jgi:hypothetical protein
MKSKVLLIACAMALVCPVPVNAAGADLSAFGTPVDPTVPVVPPPVARSEPTSNHWPAHVCAEIQRKEKELVAGMQPSERGKYRLGLLSLEGLHCGIDVSKKMDADQAAMDEAHRKTQLEYDEILAAAQSAASRDPDPIIVQVPQAAPADPAPPRSLNCFTTRFGGGISSTTCR